MRVAVLGAGVCGLTAIKSCLDEGLEPVCFERTDHFGGLWRYQDDPKDGQACVMKSTIINTSKEMMSFSDFPMPDHFPVFMHNTQVVEYLQKYANYFDLEKYIHYNTEVKSVKKGDNFPTSGQWKIHHQDKTTGEEKHEVFDALLVCTGHHADKHEPKFSGISNFKGKVLHSQDYRKPSGFEDKRVLVIGIGNSGCDIAVELSRWSSQVYLSTRGGAWIVQRTADYGLPTDMLMSRRVIWHLADLLPGFLLYPVLRSRLNKKLDHDLYCLRPKCEPFQQQPTVNEDLSNRIICGKIQIKSDIKNFTETGVEFIDGTSVSDIDAVIMATGYSFGFPFLDKEVIDVQENVVNLYKNTFIPDLERQTLAIIGCVQAMGAIPPAAEIQCRAATKVFKRESFLPSKDKMWEEIRCKHAFIARKYAKSRRHAIQIEVLEFMDGLAQICGCSIDFCHLIKTDPLLAFKVFFGPLTPYQTRLYGPGKWTGAREAIMKQWDRVYIPMKTRQVPHRSRNGIMGNPLMLFGAAILLYFIFIWIFC